MPVTTVAAGGGGSLGKITAPQRQEVGQDVRIRNENRMTFVMRS